MNKNILITGGAGYVGAILTPRLINLGYNVKVVDLMMYGENVFEKSDFDKSKLELIKGDIRDQDLLKKCMKDVDVVMHLACISNDPSFDLNPELGKSINLDAFEPLVQISKAAGVKRFIYASSSSVYGVKEVPNVTEDMELEPLTDYSKFKAECEVILNKYIDETWTATTIRPATVCGYSPRQRLDVIVNILTNHAYHNREIKVFGGEQLRPNIHIEDMVDAYILLMNAPHEKVNGKIFNAGFENQTVDELAAMVQKVVGSDVKIIKTTTDDNRSYHISSKKIQSELGFKPRHTIQDAVVDLNKAFKDGLLPNSMTDSNYFNIKVMLNTGLK
jgi:nucleoside-diphosphate-sugar epimerase